MDNQARGCTETTKTTRDDIIDIAQCAWKGLPHERVADNGYRQTGLTMPLEGPDTPSDIFKNLLEVLQELDPTSTPTEVAPGHVCEEPHQVCPRRCRFREVDNLGRLSHDD